MNINKIIIWGHKLHDHTHSYIHNAFFKTFKHLGYKTHWFSNDYNKDFDFNNSLFLTHGLECYNIPINNSSFYLFHNCHLVGNDLKIPYNHILKNKNLGINKNNILFFQVLTKECYFRDFKFNNNHIYRYNTDIIYFPWATDLLPNEIDKNIENLKEISKKNKEKLQVNFVGMPLQQWDILKKYIEKNNIKYNNYGGTFDVNSDRNKTIEENQELIQKSIIAPALQTQWQIDNHYIPCRIFKNISYGKMGITNNEAVYNLFNQKIIYSKSIEECIDKGLEFENINNKDLKVKELMEIVRDNHTYINRIHFILDFIKEKYNIKINK